MLSTGAKINDLGWPWRVITHCFKTCAMVLLLIYSFI